MSLAKIPVPVVLFVVAGLQFLAASACGAVQQRPEVRNVTDWPQHSMDRPRPPVVDPGRVTASAPPPSDATVLFDGRSLAGWEADGGGAAGWTVRDGYFEVAPGTGGIHTRQTFGDVQLHVEWSAPDPPAGAGQDRGNSGVFLMGRYEVQVLDSYRSDTYPDGMAGALYGQYPPLVNATRPPGDWNVYDIVFRAPRFLSDGTLDEPARVTVFHNGVLVQYDQALVGPTSHDTRAPYEAHADRLPIGLQDHDHPVRFRNVWVREM
jgi:hypothetical protein